MKFCMNGKIIFNVKELYKSKNEKEIKEKITVIINKLIKKEFSKNID